LLRKKTLQSVYVPKFQNLSSIDKLKLAQSGTVWWSYSKLDEREVCLFPTTSSLLQDIDKSAIQLKDYNPLLDNHSPVWEAFRLAMTHHSTAIEGNKLSKKQVKVVIDEFGDGISQGLGISEPLNSLPSNLVDLPAHDVLEVVNHAAAMEYIKKNMFGKNITVDSIRNIFDILLPSVNTGLEMQFLRDDHGNFRKCPIRVRGCPSVRPYPHEVPSSMDRILDLYNTVHTINCHPVVAAIIFHANFLFVHPFPDGNGRVSRLILMILLYNSGYFGCVFPVEERRSFISTFTPYFCENNIDKMVEYIAKRVNIFHKELKIYRAHNNKSSPEFDKT
jgi:Fic family protein